MQDKIGKVSTSAFINEFLRLGKVAREKEFYEVKVANDKIIEKKKKFQAKREEIALRMIKYEIPKKWSAEEEESAQFKFGQACLNYDSTGKAGIHPVCFLSKLTLSSTALCYCTLFICMDTVNM